MVTSHARYELVSVSGPPQPAWPGGWLRAVCGTAWRLPVWEGHRLAHGGQAGAWRTHTIYDEQFCTEGTVRRNWAP